MQQESQIRAFTPLSLTPRYIPPESAKARQAYADYEQLGNERSLAKLVQHYGKKPSYLRQLQHWSSDYNWQQRIADYERQQLEERRKKRQAEIEAMDEYHADLGRTEFMRAIEVIERHIATNDTTLASAVTLMKASYELERLARGAATSRMEGDIGVTILPKMYINITEEDEGSDRE